MVVGRSHGSMDQIVRKKDLVPGDFASVADDHFFFCQLPWVTFGTLEINGSPVGQMIPRIVHLLCRSSFGFIFVCIYIFSPLYK